VSLRIFVLQAVSHVWQVRGFVTVHPGAKIYAFSFCTSSFQSDPHMIKEIVEAVSIPVMAKVRIGHFVEAQVATLTVK